MTGVTVQIDPQIRIHAMQTGTVQVKPTHRQFNGPAALRFPAILGDPRWTPPLPIYTWLIEHPEGAIVVDTGESPRFHAPAYFACDRLSGTINRHILRIAVDPVAEIGPQLQQRGIDPTTVRKVVLTHLHIDHTDGLYHFPNAQFLVARTEMEYPFGATPCTFPTWFQPTLVDYGPDHTLPTRQSYPLTADRRVLLIPTPGHTFGHQSVLVRGEKIAVLLAGDLSFSDSQLLAKAVAGIVVNVQQTKQSYQQVIALARQMPLIYLPSHDPASAERLHKQQCLL